MTNTSKNLIILEAILTTLLAFYITTATVYAYVESASWSWNPSVIYIGDNTYAFGKLTHRSVFFHWMGEIKVFIDGALKRPEIVASQNAGDTKRGFTKNPDGWWYYGSGCQGGYLPYGATIEQWIKAHTTSYSEGSFYGYVRPAWLDENPVCGVFPHGPSAGGYLIVKSSSGIPYSFLNVTNTYQG